MEQKPKFGTNDLLDFSNNFKQVKDMYESIMSLESTILDNASQEEKDNFNLRKAELEKELKELEASQKEFEEEFNKNGKVKGMKESIKKEVEEKIAELTANNGDPVRIARYTALLNELDGSYTLDILLKYPVLTKKVRTFDELVRVTVKKLKGQKKYRFRNIIPLLSILTKVLGSKEDAKTFLFHFYSFIMTNDIKKHSVFISQTISNISLLAQENDLEFVDNIRKVVNLYKK